MKFHELTLNGAPGGMYEGHCANHPEVRYLTKGPGRSLFFSPDPDERLAFIKANHRDIEECDCPLEDIVFPDPEVELLHTNPWDVAR